ncbi:hypothetical protein LJ707_19205 [Mucilaginibacter sp. UR6-1]|uniref:hypothetical protein n=1 Tax=Mucilaginibacter sp. UR6-1 TaxID=1435643 RepID=UPI001E3D253D|nr:hypothetical protein [Mucilaginibacter sp. UR6-1]MCC8411077.1 hypothetical protein [Mucilaginibacter sp. UR6-1]
MKFTKAPHGLITILALFVVLSGCYEKPKKKVDVKPSFKKVWGIKYTEIKRWLANGLTFDKGGYQLEPEWLMSFPSDDSANIYSPERKVFYNFPVTYDHDSIVNMARSWLRVKKVSKDSLVFQILKVEGTTIYLEDSKFYMTLYADDYIKNVLKTDAKTLMRPSKADTAFIRARSEYVNTHPDTAFAAREPAQFISKSPNVKVEKVEVHAEAIRFDNVDPQDAYMYPEYNITIKKAYSDFKFTFAAFVDGSGGLHFDKPLIAIMPDDYEQKVKVMKGVMDGYLKLYLTTLPGTTLGIPHTSRVTLRVKGIKG